MQSQAADRSLRTGWSSVLSKAAAAILLFELTPMGHSSSVASASSRPAGRVRYPGKATNGRGQTQCCHREHRDLIQFFFWYTSFHGIPHGRVCRSFESSADRESHLYEPSGLFIQRPGLMALFA